MKRLCRHVSWIKGTLLLNCLCVLHPFWVSLCAVTLSPGGLLCRSYLNPNPATHQPPVVISLSTFVSFSHRLYPSTFDLFYLTDCCSSLQSGPFYWTHNSSLCSRIIHNDTFFPPRSNKSFYSPSYILKYCIKILFLNWLSIFLHAYQTSVLTLYAFNLHINYCFSVCTWVYF